MACKRGRRWFVEDEAQELMFGFDYSGKLGLIPNVPWARPFLFARKQTAFKIALENSCSVRLWTGEIFRNRPPDKSKKKQSVRCSS